MQLVDFFSRPYARLVRPKQWMKSAFVFAPLFFAHQFTSLHSWILTLIAALCFICISAVVYIGNDIRDIEEDRAHPDKKQRPLAAGLMRVEQAMGLAAGFAAAALFLMLLLPYECAVVAVVYVLLNFAYTLYLKRIAILDIFFVASCYVLRVLMGCYALKVSVSPWIILTTFLLALFLGFGKRYHEMGYENYVSQKLNLQHYNRNLLDKLVTISGGAALITYAIYAAEIARQMGEVDIVYTVAFVAFGLFRYLQSIYVYNQGGEPETILFKDRLQLLNAALWLVVTLWILS
jgi:4-hydroxybenzoate polyprenyltransferase